jgi:hypothetical protein
MKELRMNGSLMPDKLVFNERKHVQGISTVAEKQFYDTKKDFRFFNCSIDDWAETIPRFGSWSRGRVSAERRRALSTIFQKIPSQIWG